jgi:hypothetical protein
LEWWRDQSKEKKKVGSQSLVWGRGDSTLSRPVEMVNSRSPFQEQYTGVERKCKPYL